MILAKCIENVDPWGDKKTDLVIGDFYEVESISMGSSYTSIRLIGKSKCYNSVMFIFYEVEKELNIYQDKRFNPYL